MVLHTQLVGAPELIPFSASSERRALQSLWGKQCDPAEYRVFRQQQGRAHNGTEGYLPVRLKADSYGRLGGWGVCFLLWGEPGCPAAKVWGFFPQAHQATVGLVGAPAVG
jgi:hypothetical protein